MGEDAATSQEAKTATIDLATGGALTLVSLIRLCMKIDLGQHEEMGWLTERGRGCRDGPPMITVVVDPEEVFGLVMAWR